MRKNGLTLLEILIALVLISITSLGMVNLFIGAKKWIGHSQARMGGGELGSFFLDPLSGQVRQDQWGSNCLSSDGIDEPCGFNPHNIAGTAFTYTPEYTRDSVADTDLRRVQLKLNWNEANP